MKPRIEPRSIDARPLAERLARARALVSSLYRPGTPGDLAALPFPGAELEALRDSVHRFGIPEQPFQDLISGMEMDLTKRRYESWAELDLYCYRVAGVVGLMMAPMLGCSEEWALGPAADLGRAMQLTNILRDVKEDLDRDRVYLPLQELAAFGLTVDDLHRGVVDDRWRGFMTGLFKWKIDMLSDHSIHLYAQHIAAAVENETRAVASGKKKTAVADVALPEAAEHANDAESTASAER